VIARSTTATTKTARRKKKWIRKMSEGPTQNIYKTVQGGYKLIMLIYIYMVGMIEMDVSSIPDMVTNNIRASRYRVSHGSSVSRVQWRWNVWGCLLIACPSEGWFRYRELYTVNRTTLNIS
jgi:hypothetical protein